MTRDSRWLPSGDASVNEFCSTAGTSVGKVITTSNNAVYGIAGAVMRHFPTVAKANITLPTITAIAPGAGPDLVLGGLVGDKNVLRAYDAETDSETQLIGPANEVEIYRLHYVGSNIVMFDGLRFVDNAYIVGRVDLGTLEITETPTGSSRLVNFQTF